MLAAKSRLIISCLLGLSILIFAWFLQERLFLNWDASWLMHAAERLLAGGTYTTSFFETNPPLILILYLPAVLLSQGLQLSLIITFRIYIFVLALFSLLLCFLVGRPLFAKKDQLLLPIFMLALEVAFLVLPLHELGQRDHLMVVLTMPYLLAFACRLEGLNRRVFPGANWLIGLLAGFGYALKPHFLLTPLLLEVYGLWRKRRLSFLLCPESLTLLSFIGIYGLSIVFYFPDYLSFIVPFSMRHYYSGISSSWFELLSQPLLLLSALPLLWVVFFYDNNRHRSLCVVLLLALLGFIFSYLAQRTVFYYHLIPLFSITLLLLAVFFAEFLQDSGKSKAEMIFAMALGLFIFSLPLAQGLRVYNNWALHKSKLNPLISFIHQEACHQPIYFFASTTIYTFPTIDYAEAKLASRIPFMWMVSGLVNAENRPGGLSASDQADKQQLGDMIAEDFSKEKPLLVFVDSGEWKPYIHKTGFDYLSYFSENKHFEKEWRHYAYLMTLEQPGLYTLRVYKRKPS